ncbi:hypothetical protein CROQUDRAFT_512052 [Cronartium quercuum f. sp. fusiforme G11]|uniref:DUF4219 domain-containing protein n=1 Tax=Cronartium quercuum f. sp. fusiforme G11 TaxID=708437 RepID=A0A9P6TCF0_9BASI|nr:hypothetical protein CROQUDRAFT_512052 [Cronartium quercuum f. sp. fusiforme G11]
MSTRYPPVNPGLATALTALSAVPATSRMLLTESNYAVWTIYMECELDNLSLLAVVDGTFILREDSSAEDLVNFAKLEKKSFNFIVRHLDEVNLAIATQFATRFEKTGSGLWHHLKAKYMPNNVFHQTFIFSKFLNIKYTTCAEFCKEIRSSLCELDRVGLFLPDQTMVIMILTKLPKELESIVRFISHTMDDSTDIDFVLNRLEHL